jgi:Ca-activated chloride channel homolog
VARFRYRSGKSGVAPLPPVTRANGALPDQPKRLLGLPEPEVLAQIKAAWREDRKPANILLVVDVSGSMEDEDKIGQARKGLRTFLDQLSPKDRVGLTVFSGDTQELAPIAPFAENGASLRSLVSELVADGDTALYDATLAGWDTVDRLADDTRINAVVLLSDGEDTASDNELSVLLSKLKSRGEGEGRQIRIFSIAYGKDASLDVLEQISEASGGEAFEGDPEDIAAVYVEISSYF